MTFTKILSLSALLIALGNFTQTSFATLDDAEQGQGQAVVPTPVPPFQPQDLVRPGLFPQREIVFNDDIAHQMALQALGIENDGRDQFQARMAQQAQERRRQSATRIAGILSRRGSINRQN